MDEITRKDGEYYYGSIRCKSVDDAYCRFREDYHEEIGRRAYRRLNRVGQRQERIHGCGFDFTEDYSNELARKYAGYGRVRCWIMGLVGISYCRMVGIWDWADIDDDAFWEYLDWLFDRRSNATYVVGKNYKAGRTAKNRNRRYR